MLLSGAEILVEELIRHQVTTIFGYPGGTVLDIYDALYRNCSRINHIISAHEQGAAHAADGYARISGKTGVVLATSGPGATNLVTGIANAYLDSVPLVAITGNVSVALLGRDSFQEVDIVGVTQPIVKHSYIVREVKELERVIKEAFHIANSGRKGPVLIDIAKSVQKEKAEYIGNELADSARPQQQYDYSEVLAAIAASQRPYIYCGGGVVAAHAESEILALSERLSAPVGMSMMGLTALPNDYPLNLGMCGMHGKYAASLAQSEADLLIAVGVRFSDRATGNVSEYTKKCNVIHIDIDDAEIGKNVPSLISLCGDAKKILQDLLPQIAPKRNEQWLAEVHEIRCKGKKELEEKDGFTPQNIIELVNSYTKPDTTIVTDVGQHQMWVMQYYKFREPRTLLTSGGLGAMGYGLGAAIGGCIARERQRTVLFTGDGSFGMNLTELATAVSQRLPLTIIIINNGVLGMVRQWQKTFYDCRYSHTTLGRQTDFMAVAKAFGAAGYRATNLNELQAILDHDIPSDGPCVIDCQIDMDENVLPMIPPGGSVREMIIK